MHKNTFQDRAEYGFRKTFATEEDKSAYLKTLAKRNRQQLGWPKASKSSYPYWLGIAASLALIVSLGLYFFTPSQPHPSTDLFASNYTPLAYSPAGITRDQSYESVAQSKDETLEAAVKAYQQQDFAKANSFFAAYLRTQPQDLEHRMYFGLTLLATEQTEQAARELAVVTEKASDIHLKETALWYQTLALWKAGQREGACQLMKNYQADMSDFLLQKRAIVLQNCL